MRSETRTTPVDVAVGLPLPVGDDELPLARRLAWLFVGPVALFARLRQRPTWAAPLLISVAAGILAIVLLPDQVFYEAMQGATTRRGEPVAITSSPESVAMWERLRLSFGVAVTHPIKALLASGFLTLVFTRLLRGSASFVHYLAVTTHALLISALGALVALPLQIAYTDPSVRVTPELLLTLVYPAAPSMPLLAGIDLFTLWTAIVLGVGVGVVNRWRAFGVPIGVLVGLYLAVVIGISYATA